MRSIAATTVLVLLVTGFVIMPTPAGAIAGDDNTSPVSAEGTADGGVTDVVAGSGDDQAKPPKPAKPSKPAEPVYSSCTHHGSLSAALSRVEPFNGLLGDFTLDEGFDFNEVLDATGVNECERIDDSTLDQYLTQDAAPAAAEVGS